MDANCIVIGAGAAGLIAAKEIAAAGKKVIVLEARNRIGGRINTINGKAFTVPAEQGAEFIHGDMPVTLQLLKEAGISFYPTKGKMVRIKNGEKETTDSFAENWDELIHYMQQLKKDQVFSDFLLKHFSDKKYTDFINSVKGFAAGFDLADITKASTIALCNEWMEGEEKQYRINGGYRQLTDYLHRQSVLNGTEIHMSSVVKEISWQTNKATIVTTDKKIFTAGKIIITVPVGILSAKKNSKAAIHFSPAINAYTNAFRQIGFGSVIKILLQFSSDFWNTKKEKAAFFMSDEVVPTWWTQAPQSFPLLTGWLAERKNFTLKNQREENILMLALQSLSSMFKINMDELRNRLVAWDVYNWSIDPFAAGAYSYAYPKTEHALKILNHPVNNTLFFAGEALSDNVTRGTVEAALQSGRKAALSVLAS